MRGTAAKLLCLVVALTAGCATTRKPTARYDLEACRAELLEAQTTLDACESRRNIPARVLPGGVPVPEGWQVLRVTDDGLRIIVQEQEVP